MEIEPSRSPPEPSSGVGPSSTTPLRNAWKVPTPQEIEAVNQQNRFNQLVAQQQAAELAADKKGKPKDLSHVPCKFFKAGSCTAGSSCPFSHGLSQPGTSKPICQWYAKGSCKFGHKCALAHILPGQPMSQDRKNKRAAQAAAREGAGAGPTPAEAGAAMAGSPPSASRTLGSGLARSLKQSSEPVKNGKGVPFLVGPIGGELAGGLGAGQAAPGTGLTPPLPGPAWDEDQAYDNSKYSSGLVNGASSSYSPSNAVGSSSLSPQRPAMAILSGAGSSAQPSSSIFGTSPFTGSRALFMPSSYGSDSAGDAFPRSPPVPHRAWLGGQNGQMNGLESALDDTTDDEGDEAYDEAFLPSSLNDLLTPDERRRRASKAGFQPSVSVPAEFTLNGGPTRGPWGSDPTAPSSNNNRQNSSTSTVTRSLLSLSAYNNSISPKASNLILATSPPPVSLLHPLPQGVYSSSFDPNSAFNRPAHDPWAPPSTAPAFGPGSLPGGLAAGLSSLHLQPAIHSGETPPSSAMSILFGSHPGSVPTANHPSWGGPATADLPLPPTSSPGRVGGVGSGPVASLSPGPGPGSALPRRMSSQLVPGAGSGFPSPLQQSQSIVGADGEDVDDIQFEMDG